MRRFIVPTLLSLTACGPDAHEHSHEGAAKLTVSSIPHPPAAGLETRLELSLTDAHGNAAAGLERSHGRSIHVLLASKDLLTFAHLHPEDFGPVGEADLAAAKLSVRYSFPTAGSYLAFADWCRKGMGERGASRLDVAGQPAQASPDGDFTRVKAVGPLKVALHLPGGNPVAGQEAHFELDVRDGSSAPVTDLEMYLGAEAHLFWVKEDLSVASHGHPHTGAAHAHCADRAQVYFGPKVPFRATFPSPGRYKLWLEFQRGGQVRTVGYLVDVQ